MRKLKVGVWLHEGYKPEAGGGFGYYERLVENLKTLGSEHADIIFISYQINPSHFPSNESFQVDQIKPDGLALAKCLSILYSLFSLFGIKISRFDFKQRQKNKEKGISENLSKKIDVIYYPTPDCPITYFPFIYTLWDLGHVSTYAFPEMSMNGLYEKRQKHHSEIVSRAFAIFCESQIGKEQAIRYLNLYPERIHVVPLFPSKIVETTTKVSPIISLQNTKFVHYPAQYWAHKNHFNLIQAFKEVIKVHPELHLVLTGGDKGNKNYIIKLIKEHDLQNRIIDLGFVNVESLKWLYQNSMGLVMPTFLGPTNMPLLEAAELNCPVACSDLPGHREQLEDYAIYFKPEDAHSIKNAILEMLDENREHLSKKYTHKNHIDLTLNGIEMAFEKIKTIRFTWSHN